MHINFDASGREQRMLHLDAARRKEAVEAAEHIMSQNPRKTIEQSIQGVTESAMVGVREAHKQSYWWSTDFYRKAGASKAINDSTEPTLDAVGHQLDALKDKTLASTYALARKSTTRAIDAQAQLLLAENAISMYQKDQERLRKLRDDAAVILGRCGEEKKDANFDAAIESINKSIAHWEAQKIDLQKVVNANDALPEFDGLHAAENRLRELIIGSSSSSGVDIDVMLRDSLTGKPEEIMKLAKAIPDAADRTEAIALIQKLNGLDHSWWWGRSSRVKLIADYMSRRFLERPDTNPASVEKRIEGVLKMRVGQELEFRAAGGTEIMTIIGISEKQVRLRDSSGESIVLFATKDPADQKFHAAGNDSSGAYRDFVVDAPTVGPTVHRPVFSIQ